MLRTTFWVGNWQKVRAVLREDLANSLRVQHVSVDGVLCPSCNRVVDKASIRYGAQGTVHEPFLIPHRLERSVRDFAQQIKNVPRSKGWNPRLIRDSEIGVSRIERCPIAKQPLGCEQGSLEGKVHMDPGSQVATVLEVACTRNSVFRERSLTVLHCQPGREPAEQSTRRNLTAHFGTFEAREFVEVSDRSRSDWLVPVLGEGDVAG